MHSSRDAISRHLDAIHVICVTITAINYPRRPKAFLYCKVQVLGSHGVPMDHTSKYDATLILDMWMTVPDLPTYAWLEAPVSDTPYNRFKDYLH